MSRRLSVLLLSTWLSVPALALAEELPPEKLASIRRDEKEALEKVNAAHGGKKSSEMSTAERRQMIQEQQQAIQGVLDKHGVSSKDYARQTARMGPKQNAQVDAAEKALEARKQGSAASSPGEIPIERGWGSEQQVEQEGVEGTEGAMPVVEHGLPTEEQVPAEGEGMPTVDEAGAPEVEPVPAGEPAGEP